MKQRKTSLDLIRWDGESDGGNEGNGERSNSALTSGSNETSSDSDCPALLPNFKGIKIAPGDITKLRYKSTIAQYNNWLANLKHAFKGDPAKYPTSSQKIILAAMTMDEDLKTTYNSVTSTSPILSRHWHKFE